MKTHLLTYAMVVTASSIGVSAAAAELTAPLPIVKPGLKVTYAEAPKKIKSLEQARELIDTIGQPADPVPAFDFRDTNDGDLVMTSSQPYNVAAELVGLIRIDEPGSYQFEVYSNDGAETKLGGQTIGFFDGVQGCEGNGVTKVEIPEAGWYELTTLYFQKGGTSCLMMKWGKDGQDLEWVPNDIFGHR
ncbi:PA14 domain-containing protein [Ruegeria arenilitoris]|uniref:PA14 domain-containing protein n=1 Tax=Ruegeria arenilitoris TaxID=1173585 RepID=UPI0020C21AC4|nr:PA14 domain-containing protein [Ruegeria arenilitoris]